MKRILIISVLCSLVLAAYSQSLQDIYKSGNVYLQPVEEYGQGNNWEEIFSGYGDKAGRYQIGNDKKIIISNDGEVFMSHKNHHQIWRFSNSGKLIGKYGEKGGKPHQFAMIPSIETIVDNKYFLTTDINGRVKLFTLEGEYYKSLKMDIMPRRILAVSKNHALYAGSVLWPKNWRYVVADLDLETGDYEIVYSGFYPKPEFLTQKFLADGDTVRFTSTGIKKGSLSIPGNAYVGRPVISFSDEGNFIAADPRKTEARYYSKKGDLINEFEFDIEPIRVTEKDVEQNYQSMAESIDEITTRLRNSDWSDNKKEQWLEMYKKQSAERLEAYKDIANYMPALPYFSKIIFDSDNNMLVFEFTRKEEIVDNKFSVIAYNNEGKKVAEASLISEDYDLTITDKTILFHKGFLYAVCEKNDGSDMSLRLIKFKLSSTK